MTQEAQIVTPTLTTSNAELTSIVHPNEYGDAQPPTHTQQGQQQSFSQEQLAQLAALQQSYQQPNLPPLPQQPQLPQLDEAGQQWWNQFQQYTGVNRQDFLAGVQQLQGLPQIQQQVQAQTRDAQLATLQQELGAQFSTVMPQIAQKFAQLPPQMQAALDNIEGARLLYAQIQQEQGLGAPSAPKFDRPQNFSSFKPGAQDPSFTKDQIRSMSDADYERNQSAISYAYSKGLVR